MQRSKLPYLFLWLAALIAVSALVLLILRPGVKPPPTAPPSKPLVETIVPPEVVEKLDKPLPKEDPTTKLDELGVGLKSADPKELVDRIAKALEAGDLAALERLMGKDALDPETAARLKQLTAAGVHLRQPDGVREVGELELNTRTRWALELDGRQPGNDRIFLDLARKDGKWSVDKLTLPTTTASAEPKSVMPDALGIADTFLQAVLRQDFEYARAFVDSATVSDAKIAGLCILFEEGQYRMRKTKPLRTLLQREDMVGYLANVETPDVQQSAQFAINLKHRPAAAGWVVSEINLDELLADYARRVAGGDVYFSPLVKNPAGGDTLALYFDFDEADMNARTRRQLEIVSHILRADPGKKITLSGHTDALGTKDYNNTLSSRRADVVRDFLISAGVAKDQIATLGKGSSQPRRPNVTESGADDPAGRRVNRRTEIYLDF